MTQYTKSLFEELVEELKEHTENNPIYDLNEIKNDYWINENEDHIPIYLLTAEERSAAENDIDFAKDELSEYKTQLIKKLKSVEMLEKFLDFRKQQFVGLKQMNSLYAMIHCFGLTHGLSESTNCLLTSKDHYRAGLGESFPIKELTKYQQESYDKAFDESAYCSE